MLGWFPFIRNIRSNQERFSNFNISCTSWYFYSVPKCLDDFLSSATLNPIRKHYQMHFLQCMDFYSFIFVPCWLFCTELSEWVGNQDELILKRNKTIRRNQERSLISIFIFPLVHLLEAGWQKLCKRASSAHRKVRVFYERKDPHYTLFCRET